MHVCVRLAVLTAQRPALLPPPVPAAFYTMRQGIKARGWCARSSTVFQEQALRQGGCCYYTGRPLGTDSLRAVVTWLVDPLSRVGEQGANGLGSGRLPRTTLQNKPHNRTLPQVVIATGVALVDPRLQRLMSSPWWFLHPNKLRLPGRCMHAPNHTCELKQVNYQVMVMACSLIFGGSFERLFASHCDSVCLARRL
jgi:hypothetical protein